MFQFYLVESRGSFVISKKIVTVLTISGGKPSFIEFRLICMRCSYSAIQMQSNKVHNKRGFSLIQTTLRKTTHNNPHRFYALGLWAMVHIRQCSEDPSPLFIVKPPSKITIRASQAIARHANFHFA